MSNDLIDMSAFQGAQPAAEFAGVGQGESLADGIGQSYGILSYKGKVWSLRHRGETSMFLRKDDNSPVSYIDVVILRQAANKSKSFYAPGSYDPANPNTSPPLCASIDGIKPDADVSQKQSDSCALCPHNQFKVTADGRKRRDCSDFKRLAVFLLPSSSMLAVGEVMIEPIFLRVPPASLDGLAKFGESLAKIGWPFMSVVTRISFDPTEPHPKFIFRAIKPLSSQDAKAILALREDNQSKRITGEEGKGGLAIAPQQSVLAQPVAAAPAAAQVAAPVTAAVTQPVSPPPPPPTVAPVANNVVHLQQNQVGGGPVIEGTFSKTVTDSPPADGLIANAMAAAAAGQPVAQPQQPVQPTQVVQPAQQTTADIGNADVDLDSQIASFLAKQ